jgi:hypothetical protein
MQSHLRKLSAGDLQACVGTSIINQDHDHHLLLHTFTFTAISRFTM